MGPSVLKFVSEGTMFDHSTKSSISDGNLSRSVLPGIPRGQDFEQSSGVQCIHDRDCADNASAAKWHLSV